MNKIKGGICMEDLLRYENNNKSREFTENEVRAHFLSNVWGIIDYWNNISDPSCNRTEGVAFSILSMMDGSNLGIPGFIVTPNSCPEDKEYYIKRNENYYPDNTNSNIKCDIGGGLHELLYNYKDENNREYGNKINKYY